jgi:histidinol phosphatase-like PHP family hydrolase
LHGNGVAQHTGIIDGVQVPGGRNVVYGIRILTGIECDLLADGSLDYDDDLLAGFDYVVGGVHTMFEMPEPEMTARVCKALSHPRLTILGHSTGRLLLKREGYKINLDAVLKSAAEHGKMIEINAQPSRLDLDWVYVKRAKALGIPIVINPDAHSTGELAYYTFGVNVARRGWLMKDDVFNTRSLADVVKELERLKGLHWMSGGASSAAGNRPSLEIHLTLGPGWVLCTKYPGTPLSRPGNPSRASTCLRSRPLPTSSI